MMRILGVSDEVDACECCGRQKLKRTIALELPDGSATYYGTSCAAQALGWEAKTVRAEARKAQQVKDDAAAAERSRVKDAECAAWFAFVAAASGLGDFHKGLEALGGLSRTWQRFRLETGRT